MELYIRVKDGKPLEHPILGDNFRAAFPHIDTQKLPPDFARFIRTVPPTVGPYEVYIGATYEADGDFYTDVHHVHQMTNEERLAKQAFVKMTWQETGFASWLFDEKSCGFKPPVSRPNDGKNHHWDEASLSWVEA